MAKIDDLFPHDRGLVRRVDDILGDDDGDVLVVTILRDDKGGFGIVLIEGNENTGMCVPTDDQHHSATSLKEMKNADAFAIFITELQAGKGDEHIH